MPKMKKTDITDPPPSGRGGKPPDDECIQRLFRQACESRSRHDTSTLLEELLPTIQRYATTTARRFFKNNSNYYSDELLSSSLQKVVKAIQGGNTPTKPSKCRPWLRTVIRRAAISIHRQTKRKTTIKLNICLNTADLENYHDRSQPNPLEILIKQENASLYISAMDKLKHEFGERRKREFEAHYIDGKTVASIIDQNQDIFPSHGAVYRQFDRMLKAISPIAKFIIAIIVVISSVCSMKNERVQDWLRRVGGKITEPYVSDAFSTASTERHLSAARYLRGCSRHVVRNLVAQRVPDGYFELRDNLDSEESLERSCISQEMEHLDVILLLSDRRSGQARRAIFYPESIYDDRESYELLGEAILECGDKLHSWLSLDAGEKNLSAILTDDDERLVDESEERWELTGVELHESSALVLPLRPIGEKPDGAEGRDLTYEFQTDYSRATCFQVARDGSVVATTSEMTYTDRCLSKSGPYYYMVTALDREGNETGPLMTAFVETATAAKLETDPVKPSDPPLFAAGTSVTLTATAEPGVVFLGWRNGSDIGVEAYKVVRGGRKIEGYVELEYDLADGSRGRAQIVDVQQERLGVWSACIVFGREFNPYMGEIARKGEHEYEFRIYSLPAKGLGQKIEESGFAYPDKLLEGIRFRRLRLRDRPLRSDE